MRCSQNVLFSMDTVLELEGLIATLKFQRMLTVHKFLALAGFRKRKRKIYCFIHFRQLAAFLVSHLKPLFIEIQS